MKTLASYVLVPYALLAASAASVAQVPAVGDSLSLEEAVRLAIERNGTIRAAALDVQAAGQRTAQARGSFLPTLTPTYRYNSTRQEVDGRTAFTEDGSQTGIAAGWRLLDAGQRTWTLNSARRLQEAERFAARQTLRGTLFTVHEQYFDTLRAQELQKVADAQVERAQKLLEQTQVLIEVGSAPQKDLLQARADLLNARVAQLETRSRTATTEAALKATIGWPVDDELPQLEAIQPPVEVPATEALEELREEGLVQRPDLEAQRRLIESQGYTLRRLRQEATFAWAIDANYERLFSPTQRSSRGISFVLSFPLFDGGRARAAAEESRLNIEASRYALSQAERAVAAEIEAAVRTYSQNGERLEAASLALEAARQNYEAAIAARGEQAAGTNVITVLTAQVSLVTAESNYIESLFDYYISDVRLRLVTGRPIPGENL